jgi:serine/threonine-protein kinase RsbW
MAGIGSGATLTARHRSALEDASEPDGPDLVLSVERTVRDSFENGPPPMPALDLDLERDGAANIAVALAVAAESHPGAGPDRMAELAGTALADRAMRDGEPADSAQAADLLVRTHRALGSDAEVLHADDQRIEVAVRRCPFGDGAAAGRSLCHVSTGMAGRITARAAGRSTVVLEEAIAHGDPECHLQVFLGEPEGDVAGEKHRWPPVDEPIGVTPQLELSVQLPREVGSVPVVRRLAAQALTSFGVHEEDIADVQVAISEACANVIDHAADTDTYEVQVELAADRCAITVIDQGGGFDPADIGDAELNAESGRGLTLMRALFDNVAFHSEPQAGAVVHMVKSLRYDEEHPLWSRQG